MESNWIFVVLLVVMAVITGILLLDCLKLYRVKQMATRKEALRVALEQTCVERIRSAVQSCKELLTLAPQALLEMKRIGPKGQYAEGEASRESITCKLEVALQQFCHAYAAFTDDKVKESEQLLSQCNASIDSALHDAETLRFEFMANAIIAKLIQLN